MMPAAPNDETSFTSNLEQRMKKNVDIIINGAMTVQYNFYCGKVLGYN
jgi:hypothetical protein